ncbi:hypothetical protein BDZ91DRAFT_196346 [Kalaharituber pfeilii]|nr:hypothetical protein BDZ91DRAFT_196346 [Kalaharituber pfeilii]
MCEHQYFLSIERRYAINQSSTMASSSSTSSSGSSDNAQVPAGPTAFPWHHRAHLFPTENLAQRFASRPQPKKKKPGLPPGILTSPSPYHPFEKKPEPEEVAHIATLQEVEKKCPLYEMVQYQCDPDMINNIIRCVPVVRLFRK